MATLYTLPDFNPRSPCGERHCGQFLAGYDTRFQSTLPVWGATLVCFFVPVIIIFQSTLPVWGATIYNCFLVTLQRHFNPRSPCGERLSNCLAAMLVKADFNPRSPCGERRPEAARFP